MAEPLSSIASVFTVVECALQSTKYLLAFFRHYSESPSEVRLWLERLESLHLTLKGLQELSASSVSRLMLSPSFCHSIGECAKYVEISAKKLRKSTGTFDANQANTRRTWNHQGRIFWHRIKWIVVGGHDRRRLTEVIALYQFEFSLELLKISV